MKAWISVLEAAYELSLAPEAWLEHLLDKAAPLLDRGVGVNAQTFQVSASHFALVDVIVHGESDAQTLRQFLEHVPPHIIDCVYRRGAPVGTLSEWLFPDDATAQAYFLGNAPNDFQDSTGLVAHTGQGWGLVLAAPLIKPQRLEVSERRRWTKVAAHLAAGLRLRQQLGGLDIDAPQVEAILTPDGRIEHVSDAAKSPSARERLRAAVRRVDRARTGTYRQDSDAALDLWEGLVAGRWSLVDRFDSDGRRYLIAVKNDPQMPDPRGLSLRERQVVEFFGMGRPTKEIAYILGLSTSTVANTLAHAQAKLSMATKTELAAFFSPTGMRARLQEIDLAGEQLAVGSLPLTDEKKFTALTEAEREVAIELMRGATYAAIASKRGSAERTIANQAQSIYRKMGVNSRVELSTALGTV